jgi:hypothetical protein
MSAGPISPTGLNAAAAWEEAGGSGLGGGDVHPPPRRRPESAKPTRVPYRGPGSPFAHSGDAGSASAQPTAAPQSQQPQRVPYRPRGSAAGEGVSEYEAIAGQYRQAKKLDPLSESAAEYESAWWNSITSTLQQQDTEETNIVKEMESRFQQSLTVDQRVQLQHQVQACADPGCWCTRGFCQFRRDI